MEEIFLKVFSETGIIAGLFVATFLAFLWRGVPAIYRKFEEMEQRHREETKTLHISFQENFDKQRITFENTMNNVVLTFNGQVQNSSDWHKQHSNDLVEIKNEIKNLKRRKTNISE